MRRTTLLLDLVTGLLVAGVVFSAASAFAEVPVALTFSDGTDDDQDDMAIWVHPTDPARSTIIGSDKGNGNVYVYDLSGAVIQTVSTGGQPGNIDVRYGFSLGDQCIDVVGFNDRTEGSIRVYQVDASGRTLSRIDDGQIATGANYGFGFYQHSDGRLFGHTGPKGDDITIQQFELFDNGQGRISGEKTGWSFDASVVEGIVGDDDAGYVFLGEESEGIWRVNAMDATDRAKIASVGDATGLTADVEGLAIYRSSATEGYLIASSQGADKFTVLDRIPPHRAIGEFRVDGVGSTDGIEVLNVALGESFPQGIFLMHNGADCCPIQAVRWQDVAQEVGGLAVEPTNWHPRDGTAICESPDIVPPAAPTDLRMR